MASSSWLPSCPPRAPRGEPAWGSVRQGARAQRVRGAEPASFRGFWRWGPPWAQCHLLRGDSFRLADLGRRLGPCGQGPVRNQAPQIAIPHTEAATADGTAELGAGRHTVGRAGLATPRSDRLGAHGPPNCCPGASQVLLVHGRVTWARLLDSSFWGGPSDLQKHAWLPCKSSWKHLETSAVTKRTNTKC